MTMDTVVVEVTGTSGNYIDSIVVEDEDDIRQYLNGFLGTDVEFPSVLEWLDDAGDIIAVEPVLFGVSGSGRPFAWRTVH